jgi:ferredoxin
MSHAEAEKEVAPKRARMMDMILALGGLREETAVPLSKVKAEIASLQTELAPLTEEIIAFPDKYLKTFLTRIEQSGLLEQVRDKGILKEAVATTEKSVDQVDSEYIRSFHSLLDSVLQKLEDKGKPPEEGAAGDLGEIVKGIPVLIPKIESVLTGYEEQAASEAEAASTELDALVTSLNELIDTIDDGPLTALESLQKLGTKTRYGNFLRTTAQVKRGHREGRIDDDRLLILVKNNILTELRRGIIMFVLNNMGSKTVVQLADIMRTPANSIQHAIVTMIQRGDIEMVGLDGDAPLFTRVIGKPPNATSVIKRIIQQLRGILSAVSGDAKETVESIIAQLDALYERLRILGEYDETLISGPLDEMRKLVDDATEATLSTQTSDDSEELQLLVSAGLEAFARFRLKIALEKGPNLVTGENVYGEKLDPEQYQTIMDTYLDNELERGTLLILIRELGAMTAHDLAVRTKIPQDRVFRHLLRMKRDELLVIAGESHGYILYDVPRLPNEAEIAIQTVSDISFKLVEARVELEKILGDLKAEDIGNLANALEAFSRGRDSLAKLTVAGTIIGEGLLSGIEEKIRSAVLLAYRTRAKLPSTRPKVTIEDIVDVDVPSVLEEYRSQMGYAPLLGFGTIDWEHSKCLGCKSCEISCPEDAIELKQVIDVPQYFEFTDDSLDELPVNRSLFYRTVRNLATTKPASSIALDKESPGFGKVEVDLWLCVACRTCVRRCPGPDGGALTLDLSWSLPEIVRHFTTEESF